MDYRDQMHYMDAGRLQELERVPEWARAEHMEMSVPLKQLWVYPVSLTSGNVILKRILRKL